MDIDSKSYIIVLGNLTQVGMKLIGQVTNKFGLNPVLGKDVPTHIKGN